jgi:hypothetical protein
MGFCLIRAKDKKNWFRVKGAGEDGKWKMENGIWKMEIVLRYETGRPGTVGPWDCVK